MQKFVFFLSLILAVGMLSGCASKSTHHKDKMPDPKGFNAHFPDMDSDGNDLVDWTEFENISRRPSRAFSRRSI